MPFHYTFPFLSSSARCSQERQHKAMMVQVGFWQDAFTWLDPSTTSRLGTSCDCWNWFSTDVFGSLPMREVPSSWIDQPSVKISRFTETTSIPDASNISRAVTAMSAAIFFSLSRSEERRVGK